MKKLLIVASIVVLLTSCAIGPYPSGMLFSSQTIPMDVRDNVTGCAKRGEATATNYLGYVAIGDAGVGAAKANGGITKVGSVDVKMMNILSLVTVSTTVVCGE